MRPSHTIRTVFSLFEFYWFLSTMYFYDLRIKDREAAHHPRLVAQASYGPYDNASRNPRQVTPTKVGHHHQGKSNQHHQHPHFQTHFLLCSKKRPTVQSPNWSKWNPTRPILNAYTEDFLDEAQLRSPNH